MNTVNDVRLITIVPVMRTPVMRMSVMRTSVMKTPVMRTLAAS